MAAACVLYGCWLVPPVISVGREQCAILCAELRRILEGCWRALLRLLAMHSAQLSEKQLTVFWDSLAAVLASCTQSADCQGDCISPSGGS